MKLVIVEGLDRCGKDTLINHISSIHSNIIKRHWSFPKGNTDEEKTSYQKEQFDNEFNLWAFFKSRGARFKENLVMIWNRSHLGELVYGSLYRNSKPEEWVINLEYEFDLGEDSDVYLIYLYADPEFLVTVEDGKSYSSKLEDKKKEMILFEKAINSSTIKNKLILKVNDDFGNYKSQEDIHKQVVSFINQ